MTLTGITERKDFESDFDPYSVLVDKQRLGGFGFAVDSTSQEFSFHVPPAAGDLAPDVDLVNVASGAKTKLSDLRGKVVCLDFWATWCGPCQEPMSKLNQLALDRRETWKDRVAIVPLSIDETANAPNNTLPVAAGPTWNITGPAATKQPWAGIRRLRKRLSSAASPRRWSSTARDGSPGAAIRLTHRTAKTWRGGSKRRSRIELVLRTRRRGSADARAPGAA